MPDPNADLLPDPDPARGEPSLRPKDDRFGVIVDAVQRVQDYAIFMLDEHGRVVTWNAGGERLKGYRAEEIIGQHFSRFYPEEANQRGWPLEELERARAAGRFEDEGWRVRKDGTRFWADVIITAVHDASGRLVGYLKITRDLTERRREEEELRESEERFRLLVEGVRDYAIFMLDPDGRVASWNTGAERIKGYRRDEIVGQHFSRFYPEDRAAAGIPDRELEVARAEGRFEEEGWRIRKDGTPFWANVVITPVYDRSRTLRGYAKVTRDMTERKRVETLESEGRRINGFLAVLGHELRNPLAPIRNAVAVLGARETPDPAMAWAREVIERQVAHLSRLVDDLLDVSRIASGKITLQRKPVDLGLLVSHAVEVTRPLIERRGQTLESTLPAKPLLVEGDSTRLSQVVLNLLNNSAKFTPAGGHVWVTLARQDGKAVLTVRDDGIGMSSDLVPRVFDLFMQGEHTLNRSEGGLGIGLSLVRRLVEMHGGSVQAASPGAGLGSAFTVKLPPLPQEAVPKDGGGGPAGPAHAPPRRVLVVDDDADSVETMAMLLQMGGHQVRTARDGPSALAAAAEFRPEVILLDIGLPGMTGYEAARKLKEIPGVEKALLVALTGYGQAEDRERSREAGFAVHLVKPVQPEAIERLLAQL